MPSTFCGDKLQPLAALALSVVVATAPGCGGTQSDPVLSTGVGDEDTTTRILQVDRGPKIITDPPTSESPYLQSLSTLLKSNAILDAAANDPTLASVPIVRDGADVSSALSDHLEVRVLEEPSQIEISALGLDPSEGTLVVDAVVRAFLDEVVTRPRDRQLERHEKLKKIYQDYNSRVQKEEAELRSIEPLTLDSGGAEVDRSIVEADLRDCLRQLRRVQLERAALEVRREAEGLAKPEPDRASSSLKLESAVIDRHEQLLVEQRDRLATSLARELQQTQFRDETLKELAQIQENRNEIGTDIERLNVEMNAPPPIRLLTPVQP